MKSLIKSQKNLCLWSLKCAKKTKLRIHPNLQGSIRTLLLQRADVCSWASILKMYLQRGFPIFAYLYFYWTMLHTPKTLVNKDVLAGMVLDYKERFDLTLSAITHELKELKKDFWKLESHLATSRNVNDKLTKQLILVERKCWANEQYSLVESDWNIRNSRALEDYVTKIFNEFDTPVDPANSEACHRLKSKARTEKVIVKLSKRKDVFNVLQRKKKLKSVDITKVGLPQGSLVLINQSLCSYYKYLWSLF